MTEARWTTRLSRLALGLAVVAIAVAIVGVMLARYDLIPKIAGFSALLGGGVLALAAVVAGVTGVILNWQFPTASRKAAIVALLLALPYAGFLASRPMAAGDAPAIHDITTDLAEPPAFERLALRPDNLTGVGTIENWRAIHVRAYGDLKSVTIARPAATVLADAERIARENGWDIARVDPAAGRLEATAAVSMIRFKDDVVVRVRPARDGNASIVDMRSVSRIGVGDLGVNARRIREFLNALAAT